MRQPQSVGINLTATCNAACAHCCVLSSPRNRVHLDDSMVDEIIADLITHPDVYEIGFTGGEPLLRKDRLCELIQKVTKAGKSTTVTTNGFWGISKLRATSIVKDLERSGLSHLTISWDGYHSPFVSAQRIQNVLRAMSQSHIPFLLNMCVSKEDNGLELMKELGDSVLGVRVTRYPILPCGEGKNIPESHIIRKPIESLSLRCPGYELIYHHDGRIFPCCSPPIFDTNMTLGYAGEADHEEFIQRLERNMLLAAIQRCGLAWLRDVMIQENPEAKIAHLKWAVSSCEVCTTMLSDRETLRRITPRIMTAVKESR